MERPLAGGAPLANGTFFSVSTGDAPFVNLEPTQKTGFVGARVGMFGQGFSGSSVVKFGGVAATTVTRYRAPVTSRPSFPQERIRARLR